MGPVFAIAVISVFFYLGAILLSSSSYFHRFNIKYSLRGMFPFEYNYKSRFKGNFYGNLAFILSFLCLFAFYLFFDQKHNNGFFNFVMGAGLFVSVIMGVLLFLPIYFLRAHAILDVILFVINFSIPASMMMGTFRMYQLSGEIVHLVFFIIFIIVSLACFALMLNPKLSFSFKSIDEVQPDGTIKKVRPKTIVLAFTEWMSYHLIYLSTLLIGIYILLA